MRSDEAPQLGAEVASGDTCPDTVESDGDSWASTSALGVSFAGGGGAGDPPSLGDDGGGGWVDARRLFADVGVAMSCRLRFGSWLLGIDAVELP